jgi:hypothetical protein
VSGRDGTTMSSSSSPPSRWKLELLYLPMGEIMFAQDFYGSNIFDHKRLLDITKPMPIRGSD